MKQFTYLFSVLFIFTACDSNTDSSLNSTNRAQENSSLISMSNFESPMDNVSVPANLYKIDVDKGGVIELEKGGSIIIPPNAFVHANGSLVEGSVEINYTEYRSVTDIIVSGIPMGYDSAGVHYNLVSDGMFTLNGKQGDENVAIAPGKKLDMDFASYSEDTECFNLYQISEDGEWDYVSTKKALPNPNYKINEIPVEPEEVSDEDIVFDIEVSYQGFRKFEGFESIMWKYDGTRKDTLNAQVLMNKNWSTLEIIESKRGYKKFDLRLEKSGNLIVIPVSPALSGESLEEAQADFEAKMAAIKTNEEAYKMSVQGKSIRTLEIPSFGTYNYDRIYKLTSSKHLLANFDYKSDIDPSLVNVFLITPEDNAVVSYPYSQWHLFNFDPSKQNKVIVTLPGNKVGVFSRNKFRKVNGIAENSNYTFSMKMLDEEILSHAQLNQIIESL